MILDPNKQTNLYAHINTFEYFIKLNKLNKLPNRILFSGPKGIGKCTFAYHFINYVLSVNEDSPYDYKNKIIDSNNKSFNLIKNLSHPNFFLIDIKENKNFIDISQVRSMISYANKSNFNNNKRFILIDNLEYLNLSSANALLKIIEEPNENIYFILVHDSYKKIYETLKSRCLFFKFLLSHKESIQVTSSILETNINDAIHSDLINYYFTPGHYLNLFNFARKFKIDLTKYDLKSFLMLLVNENYFKKDDKSKDIFFIYLHLYFNKIFYNNSHSKKYYSLYFKYLKKINDIYKYNLDFDSFLIEIKSKILYEK